MSDIGIDSLRQAKVARRPAGGNRSAKGDRHTRMVIHRWANVKAQLYDTTGAGGQNVPVGEGELCPIGGGWRRTLTAKNCFSPRSRRDYDGFGGGMRFALQSGRAA